MLQYAGDKHLLTIIDSINCRDGYIFSKSVKKLPEVERTWVLLDNDYKEVKDKDGNLLFKHKSCIEEYTYSYTDDDGREFIKKVKEKRVATYNPKLHKKRVFEINKMVEKARKMKASQAKKEEYGESAKYVTFKGKDGSKAEVMLNEEAIEERQEKYEESLSRYVQENQVSIRDVSRISE